MNLEERIFWWVDRGVNHIAALLEALPQYRERDVRSAVERMVDRGQLQLGLDMELIRVE